METTTPTTTETTNTPKAFYTDRVELPEIPTAVDGSPEVRLHTLSDKFSDWQRVVFVSEAQKNALTRLQENPPTTVGHLWALYLQSVAALAAANSRAAAINRSLSRINESMNEYADEHHFCDSYEQALEDMNSILRHEGYHDFYFEGRTTTLRVTIERERIVRETTELEIEVTRGSDPDYDMAYEMAGETDIERWDVQDEHYDDRDYNVIHEEYVS